MAIGAGKNKHRPQSAVECQEIKYKGIRAYIKKKRDQEREEGSSSDENQSISKGKGLDWNKMIKTVVDKPHYGMRSSAQTIEEVARDTPRVVLTASNENEDTMNHDIEELRNSFLSLPIKHQPVNHPYINK